MTNKRKWIKIVLWCLLGVMLLLIVIPLSSLLIQKYIKKSAVPMFMGYAYLVVTTGSMSGTIDQGDLIIVKSTDDYSINDIVTYIEAEGNVAITHRIVNYGSEEGMYITKGDANLSPDVLPVSDEQIAGKVVHVLPKAGLILDWFFYRGGIFYLVAMITIVIVGVYFLKATESEHETHTNNEKE